MQTRMTGATDMTYERFQVQEDSATLGSGTHPDVKITCAKTLLNDLSSLLLSLPAEQFERFRYASDNIDRYLAGYDFKGDRL